MSVEKFIVENERLMYKALYALFAGTKNEVIHERLRHQGFEMEDVFQEGRIAMIEAYHNYDESKHAKLTTYAYTIAYYKMMNMLNNNHIITFSKTSNSDDYVSRKNSVITGMKWLDKPVSTDGSDDICLMDILADERYEHEDNDFLFDVHEAMDQVLTEEQKDVFKMRLKSIMYKDIGKKYGYSGQQARNKFEQAQYKLKRCLEGKFVSGFYSLKKDGAA